MLESEKFKSRQNRKCFAYIIAGVVFQTIIILVFALTVMRIKTPSVRLGSVTVDNLNYSASGSPFFSMTLNAEIAVKNKNFGHFKFDHSTANVSYNGNAVVGYGDIIKGRAKARKTKKMRVTIDVTSINTGASDTAKLSNELNSGNVTLTSLARLRGKVTLMKVMKKKKTAEMNCTMTVDLKGRAVHILDCE
ncbi:hypothetical protein I3843_11G125800 [Carya illinoinensis]|uniref:Late embryogenesis abundant protein LEA-2 subgroup domain-containing protein n=1 Tax=Carya illinoinensis TaxID=32201 RepID=A0A8T1P4G7_CARIL|nr:late embryogenesis abundant protein At1g64065-like [Carya illinoinensis]KAG2681028.1 hypothetical protein I3760_11G125700 [Carya illinoinensis]KAG6636694.1 hypothetical protein CIPAW_11G128800 [Carya illinoinensis]KAG6688489.1 hypothetical protein I3842_11G127500 [Carya illinoinensis]KAG7956476.1 hypothetical protein I3843_11G125800 [Carya illinoinensis]